MIEEEFKYLVTREELYRIRELLAKQYPKKEKLQVNYYYDTADLLLREARTTCRIRLSEDGLVGQIKRHHSAGSCMSTETEFAVETLPQSIQYEAHWLLYQGELVTVRTSFSVDSALKIECDVNYYLGQCDYEIELEYEGGARSQACREAERLGLTRVNSISKSERFFASKTQCAASEVCKLLVMDKGETSC